MPWDFVSSRPLKNFTKYSLKLIGNGVQIEQLKTSDFFLFLQKKNETTFFQVLSHFLGFFFLLLKTLKYPWNK